MCYNIYILEVRVIVLNNECINFNTFTSPKIPVC